MINKAQHQVRHAFASTPRSIMLLRLVVVVAAVAALSALFVVLTSNNEADKVRGLIINDWSSTTPSPNAVEWPRFSRPFRGEVDAAVPPFADFRHNLIVSLYVKICAQLHFKTSSTHKLHICATTRELGETIDRVLCALRSPIGSLNATDDNPAAVARLDDSRQSHADLLLAVHVMWPLLLAVHRHSKMMRARVGCILL